MDALDKAILRIVQQDNRRPRSGPWRYAGVAVTVFYWRYEQKILAPDVFNVVPCRFRSAMLKVIAFMNFRFLSVVMVSVVRLVVGVGRLSP